jgi:hypothetical protein
MAFKMKAGKEGPMKKNFPKEFAKKAIAGAIIGSAPVIAKARKGTGYIPKNTPQTKHQSGYIPQSEGRADYIPQSQRHKYPKPEPAITGGFDPNLAGPNFNKNKNIKPTKAKKKK